MEGLQAPKRGSRWKHKRLGDIVRVIGVGAGIGTAMESLDESIIDELIIYAVIGAKSGDWWIRPLAEFLDGRFEEQTQAAQQQG